MELVLRVSYNGYYITFPRLGRGFDSLHPLKIMIEERATISDILKTKKIIENLGAVLKGEYVFKDKIFINAGDADGFLRMRIYSKNNWDTKDVVLLKLAPKSSGHANIFFRQEFETEREADEFVLNNFPEFIYSFEYSKTGSQYNLGETIIFIEDIEEIGPSVEIEASSKQELESLFSKINAGEKIESVFRKMRSVKLK